MTYRFLALALSATISFAGQIAVGQTTDLTHIPTWLAESETYGFGIKDLDQANGTHWKFITHCPTSREFLGAARRRGIRAFPYMTFYQAPLFATYYEFRLAAHPHWILVDKHGQWTRTGFWESEDAKNMYCTCPNVKGYTDALLAHVEALMRRGAGGIFLDNVHPNETCYGPRFGKHRHLFKSQRKAFADLLRRTKAIIRKYDPDGALLVNSASPATLPKEFWPWVDADMSESFICTWVAEKRWGNWHTDWNGIDKKIPPGKQVCALSYVGHTTNPVKDDLYFTYASARLMNFIWNGGGTGHVGENADLAVLYAIKLGQPTAAEATAAGVHYRRFANGIVAVNPTDVTQSIVLTNGFPLSLLKDLFNGKDIPVTDQRVTLTLPAQSGRVWLYQASTAADFPRDHHRLIVITKPGLGKTRFELDGLPMTTHSGHWKIKYEKGPNYGTFSAAFPTAGTHVLKVIDTTRKSLLVANSYREAYALNKIDMPGGPGNEQIEASHLAKRMNPANPGQFASGKAFTFVGWEGPVTSKEHTIKVLVKGTTTVIARYALQ